jgi:hypothetical protein
MSSTWITADYHSDDSKNRDLRKKNPPKFFKVIPQAVETLPEEGVQAVDRLAAVRLGMEGGVRGMGEARKRGRVIQQVKVIMKTLILTNFPLAHPVGKIADLSFIRLVRKTPLRSRRFIVVG